MSPPQMLSVVLAALLGLAAARPQAPLPAGLSAAACPNYPRLVVFREFSESRHVRNNWVRISSIQYKQTSSYSFPINTLN